MAASISSELVFEDNKGNEIDNNFADLKPEIKEYIVKGKPKHEVKTPYVWDAFSLNYEVISGLKNGIMFDEYAELFFQQSVYCDINLKRLKFISQQLKMLNQLKNNSKFSYEEIEKLKFDLIKEGVELMQKVRTNTCKTLNKSWDDFVDIFSYFSRGNFNYQYVFMDEFYNLINTKDYDVKVYLDTDECIVIDFPNVIQQCSRSENTYHLDVLEARMIDFYKKNMPDFCKNERLFLAVEQVVDTNKPYKCVNDFDHYNYGKYVDRIIRAMCRNDNLYFTTAINSCVIGPENHTIMKLMSQKYFIENYANTLGK